MRPPRPLGALIGLLAVGGAVAGCGMGTATHPAVRSGSGSFAWLASGTAPAAWPPGRPLTGGSLPRPPRWQPLSGDRGSVSFVARQDGAIVGYLNATPHSGDETLANWQRFRVEHNSDEGDRDVHRIAGVTGLPVGSSRVSCVRDSYRTSLSRYLELACLVARPRASAVVLGAAPPADWGRQRAVIERAIAGFVAS